MEILSFLGLDFLPDRPILSGDDGAFFGQHRVLPVQEYFKMEAEPLFAACELAFAVAREGEKSVPPIEPPPAMRNYLYVAQLPRRAITVAQRAIDDDSTFRRRVAADATEQGVGREGFLWLTRPAGWDIELAAITGIVPIADESSGTMPLDVPPAPANVSQDPFAANSPIPPQPEPPQPVSPSAPPLPAPNAGSAPLVAGEPASSGSIEDELANLRGLVDELSAERIDPEDGVSVVTDVPTQVQPSVAPVTPAVNDAGSKAQEAELATARSRLTELESELRAARQAAAAQANEAIQSAEAAVTAAAEAEKVVAVAEAERVAAVEAAEMSAVEAAQSSEAAVAAAVEAERVAAAIEAERVAVEAAQSSEAAVAAAVEAAEMSAVETAQSSEAAVIAAVEAERVAAVEAAEMSAAEAAQSSEAAVEAAVEAERVAAAIEAERVAVEAALSSEAAVETAVAAAETSATEASTLAEASAVKASADSQMRVDELVVERDDLAAQLGDLRHEYSLLEGAANERNLVQETLDNANTEREDLARQLRVAEQARVDLEAELGQLSGQWQVLQVELEEARTSMRGTRSVFEDSMSAMSDGLTKTEEALASSAPEAFTVDPEAFATDTDEPAVEVPVEVDEPAVEVPAEVEAPAAPDIESSDLTEVLDTYGLGSNSVPQSNEQDLSKDEPDSDPEAQDLNAFNDGMPQADASPVAEPEIDPVGTRNPFKPAAERRFEIKIPASISADPLAVIRHVVATDDVVVLVDGDAVSEMGWPETGVATRREALVKYLGDLAADTGAAQDAVFSGALSDGDELPVSRAVRVRITAPGIAPADALAELVDSYPREWPIAVVSDDPGLAEYATGQGATLLSNGQLLDLLFDRWEATQGD